MYNFRIKSKMCTINQWNYLFYSYVNYHSHDAAFRWYSLTVGGGKRRDCDRMVVEFATTYAISAYLQ